jgi:uncharacterized protein (TIGR03437 family)
MGGWSRGPSPKAGEILPNVGLSEPDRAARHLRRAESHENSARAFLISYRADQLRRANLKSARSLFLILLFVPALLAQDSTYAIAEIFGPAGPPPPPTGNLPVNCSNSNVTGSVASCSGIFPLPSVANASAQAQSSLASGSIVTSAAYTMGNNASSGQANAAAYLSYDFTVLNGPATGSLLISAVVSGVGLQTVPACTAWGYSIINSCPSEAFVYVLISRNESFVGAPSTLSNGTDRLIPNGSTLVQIAVPYRPTGAVFTVWLQSVTNCSYSDTTCSTTANQFNLQITGASVLDSTGAVVSGATLKSASGFNPNGSSSTSPSIAPGGVVSLDSTVATIQPGALLSIFGANLASSPAIWNGNFPISLGDTSVTIDGKAAYLLYVGPTQIDLQAPDDTKTGPVSVAVTTAHGTALSTVTLASFAPSFLLFDRTHVAGIILRSDGSGAYDLIGPTGSSLGHPTVAAKAGDNVELYAVGLGPTNPAVPAGEPFSGSAPTTNPVSLLINKVRVTPSFVGLSSAGLYQINLTIPVGLGTGDVSLMLSVGGSQTQSGVVISLQ